MTSLMNSPTYRAMYNNIVANKDSIPKHYPEKYFGPGYTWQELNFDDVIVWMLEGCTHEINALNSYLISKLGRAAKSIRNSN